MKRSRRFVSSGQMQRSSNIKRNGIIITEHQRIKTNLSYDGHDRFVVMDSVSMKVVLWKRGLGCPLTIAAQALFTFGCTLNIS